jgi:hypothetical protein
MERMRSSVGHCTRMFLWTGTDSPRSYEGLEIADGLVAGFRARAWNVRFGETGNIRCRFLSRDEVQPTRSRLPISAMRH